MGLNFASLLATRPNNINKLGPYKTQLHHHNLTLFLNPSRLCIGKKSTQKGEDSQTTMATESPPVEATEVPPVVEAPETVATKQPHKLYRKWTFWFDNQSKTKQGDAWGSSLRKAYTFETIEEFWSLYDQIFKPSKLTVNADFHLFKDGIEPKWEDPECAYGGKWTAMSSRKANLETMWLETLMALVGEQFDESEDICGVVASVRRSQDKLSLWTKTAANEAAQMGIGRKWKEIIDAEKISYSFHDDSKRERSAKSRYTV